MNRFARQAHGVGLICATKSQEAAAIIRKRGLDPS